MSASTEYRLRSFSVFLSCRPRSVSCAPAASHSQTGMKASGLFALLLFWHAEAQLTAVFPAAAKFARAGRPEWPAALPAQPWLTSQQALVLQRCTEHTCNKRLSQCTRCRGACQVDVADAGHDALYLGLQAVHLRAQRAHHVLAYSATESL